MRFIFFSLANVLLVHRMTDKPLNLDRDSSVHFITDDDPLSDFPVSRHT